MNECRALLTALAAFGIAACDRSQPPVQKLERAAEEAIGEVQGENLPQQAKGPYAPRNECLDQPGAAEFLLDLRNAVAARDADGLVALSAEDIFLDFGGGAGTDLLRERLSAEDGYLWDALDEILALGCSSDGARMTLPWYFAQDIPLDPYSGAVVTGEDIPLFASLDGDADELARLSWEAVELVDGIDGTYARIKWADSDTREPVEGYIEAERLRSIVDYRIGAARRNNRWRITNFVAGD